MAFGRTGPLRTELERTLPARPFSVEFWDGSSLPATSNGGPTLMVRTPHAVAHALRAPGQLGVGRAYVTGALEVDDLEAALELLGTWQPPALDRRARARLALAAVRACGVIRPPAVPAAELQPRGRRHSRERDARAVRHHYDVSNEFFALFLDASMTYSCAMFSRDSSSLEAAQRAKLEVICTKLALRRGERVLDVGCGWGSFAIHAAKEHGVEVTGITLSAPQAELARRRVAEAGVADLVEIRVQDYRELTGEFDAVASIGMVEHVGTSRVDEYSRRLAGVLRPGGRLLNHGIGRVRHGDPEAGPFSERYVFPDGAPLHLSRIVLGLERAGLAVDHAEGFPGDYVETLTHWMRRFDDRLEDAIRLAGPERVRVWRLFLRASRDGFRRGFISVYQVLCHRP